MTLVIDASVAVKWLVDEEFGEQALRVRTHDRPHVAPQHFVVEVCGAIRKKFREGELSSAQFPVVLRALAILPITEYPVTPLLPAAMEIALTFDRSIYDSFYVALALHLGCQLVTADQKLYNALAAAYPETMLWIEDVPVP